MKFNRKLIIIFYIILVNISYAWWDDDFEYCRNLILNETIGLERTYEIIDIAINTSEWEHKPSENSIRVIDSDCSGVGREIPSQIYNQTIVNSTLEFFNLVFEANSSAFENKVYSIYYSTDEKEKPFYEPIEVVEQRRSWWIETENYNFYYSLRTDEGLTVLKYVRDGDFWTNYAGTYGNTPLSILHAGPKGRFKALSIGPVCFIYQRYDGDRIIFKICKNSEAIVSEYLTGDSYYITNFVRSSLVYDPTLDLGLYYRTNLDSQPKPSDTRFKSLNGFKFGISNTTKGTNFITAITGKSPDYSTNSLWSMMVGVDYARLLSTSPLNSWKKAGVIVTNESFEKAFERAEELRLSLDYPLSKNFKIDDEQKFFLEFKKPLIITNYNYENYVQSVLTGNPVLIYEENREFIDYFIEEYKPGIIFQLGTNLRLSNSYHLDSVSDLNKLFPKLELKQPKKTDYLILSNINDKKSMFSIPLSLNKNGFLINTSGNPENSRIDLISGLREVGISESYIFDQNIYLVLVGVPEFSVKDPVNNDDISTDTPYGDIDGDDYLELSVGRLSGSPESISFQIEHQRIFNESKTALILSSYNIPAKYFDVMVAGGTMKESWKTELTLLDKEFDVMRLVEKRSEFDQLNISVIDKIRDISRLFSSIFNNNHGSFLGEVTGSFNNIILVAKAGDFLLYSLYEFDWVESWESLKQGNPVSPKHLPLLNETNLLDNLPENQVIIYYSKGNSTHWFLPVNASIFSAYYEVFNPSLIEFNPAFYYLKYDNSSGVSGKIFDRGSIGILAMNGRTSNLQSGRTASLFFENFDKPVGESLKIVKNWNLKISNSSDLSRKRYKREYYTHNFLGDPSLTLDPQLKIRDSEEVISDGGNFIINFTVRSDHRFIDLDNKKMLIFDNFDYEVVDDEKPVIPVYKKNFILPSNSKITNISVQHKNSKMYNFDLLNFHNFSISGYYPEEIYWFTESKIIDNRTNLDLFFQPFRYHENDTIEIFDEIEVMISYETSIEILSVFSEDVFVGDDSRISLNFFSNLDKKVNSDIFLFVENNQTLFELKNFYEIKPGKNQISFDFNNTEKLGNYSISVALSFGDNIIGPKYSHFTVKERSNFDFSSNILSPLKSELILGLGKFIKIIKTYDESISVKRKGDKVVIDCKKIGRSMHIESGLLNKISVLEVHDSKLIIYESPVTLKFILHTSNGILILERKNGFIQKKCTGDYLMLKEKMLEMLEIYYSELEYIEKRI